jgi:Mitochondrial distribution and morphology protein 10
MLKFMDYVVLAFGDAADWNRDNSYSHLTATSNGIYHTSLPPVFVLTCLCSASLILHSNNPFPQRLLSLYFPFRNILFTFYSGCD